MANDATNHDPRDDHDNDVEIDREDANREIAAAFQSQATTVAVLERAQIDAMVATARMYPRSVAQAIRRITSMVIIDPEIALLCMYTLPRAGKAIVGPSIRFFEISKAGWGNCASESFVTERNVTEGYVEAVGYFIDYETMSVTRKRRRRRITDRRGNVLNEDMIIVTENAACSIAEREAMKAGIPMPAWHGAYKDVLKAVGGTVETFSATRDRVLKSFAEFGVTGDMVLGRLGMKGVEDLTLEHIPVLRGIYASLKNGEETVETMFDPRQGRPFVAVKNPLQDEQPGPVDEGGRTDRAQEGAGNSQGGGQGASGAKPAVEQRTQSAAQQAAAQANADAKPTKSGEAVPANDAEYRVFATAWIAAGKSISGVNERWKRERGLRDDCKVEARTTDDLIEARDAKINELREGAK